MPFLLVGASNSPIAAASNDKRASTAAEAAPGGWLWPVEGPRRIVRAYLAPPTPYAAGHRGIDLAAPTDGTVRAPADGTVHYVGVVVDRAVVSIRYADGVISSIEPVASELAPGDSVTRGQTIGKVAAMDARSAWSGTHCRSPCIHLGVRVHGDYVSPLNYLGGIPRAVLLPTRTLG
ncbi:M23 family metallopeptidase [Salinibacterium sp. GXW1014]|uniref:M23 family metallopeptidase n=1 Tax=Salinibacterium sp. GXW1014 TaxID=3377838 RepID=UPI00383A7615